MTTATALFARRVPEDVLAAAVAALEAAGWKRLEDAPKDGQFFAAFPAYHWDGSANDFPYVISRWAEAEGDPNDDDFIEAGWYDSEGSALVRLTHWYPLPHIFGRQA